jgi:hypothetical protein
MNTLDGTYVTTLSKMEFKVENMKEFYCGNERICLKGSTGLNGLLIC